MSAVFYTQARSEMKSGDLLFFRGKGLLGWLVRWWTKSGFAHVGVIWKEHGRVFCMDAAPWRGVRIIPVSNLLEARVLSWQAMDEEFNLEFALSQVGRPYSFLDALRAGLGRAVRPDGRYQCAEYAGACLGLPDAQNTPRKLITETLLKLEKKENE